MECSREICVNILNDISREFLAAKFFSIIMDEATDVSHKEQVILYVRFLRHGLIKTKFCGIFRVSRGNARQITDGLLDSLRTRFAWQFEGNATSSTDEPLETSDSSAADSDDWGSADENPLDKSDDEQREPASIDSVPAATAEKPEGDKQGTHPILIGMASDGASVLSGKKGGVQAILTKEVNSHIVVYIWCISHCLQLSLKDALKKDCKEFKDLNDFLLQLYPFHTYLRGTLGFAVLRFWPIFTSVFWSFRF